MPEIETQCSLEEFIPLLDLCLNENDLNKIICKSNNISVLCISLKVKHYYISKGIHSKTFFSIDDILNQISYCTAEKTCEILKLCLLVQSVDSITLKLMEYLQNFKRKEQSDLYIVLKILYVIVEVYCSLKLILPDYFNTFLIKDLYVDIFNSNCKSLQNFFCRFLSIYSVCSDNLTDVLSAILSFKDIYTMSCCIQSFIKYGNVNLESFWLLIMEYLQSSNHKRKLSLHIIKHYIDFVIKQGTFSKQPDIIKGVNKSESEFSKSWTDYLMLIEVSQEKQLHLVAPSLVLIPNIASLHFRWKICLYKLFLSHPQNAVVFYVINSILETKLDDSIELFRNAVRCILPALNKCKCDENFLGVFQNLGKVLETVKNEHFCVLLRESLEINWSPVPAWRFYSTAFGDYKRKVNIKLILSILKIISKLPHVFIRDSCYLILVKFITKQHADIKIKEYVELAYQLKICNEKCLNFFYQYTRDIIEIYNENRSVIEQISNFNKHISISKVQIVLELSNVSKVVLMLIDKVIFTQEVCDEVRDCLVLYLCKNNYVTFDIVDYLNRKLQGTACNVNLCIYEISKYIKEKLTNSALLKECKTILLNPDIHRESKISLAYNIYSNNLDDEIANIITLWNTKLIDGYKIPSSTCKFYLNTYFAYLHSFKKVSNVTICEITRHIFNTQTEEICLIIYENLDVTLQTLEDEHLFEFLDECSVELTKFRSTDNSNRAWSCFIASVLRNEFLRKQKVQNLVRKISEFALVNDYTAWIFVKELSKSTNENTLFFHDLIVDLLLYGDAYKSNRRCEYQVCKEIDSLFQNKSETNPIYVETQIRCFAINILLRSLQNKEQDMADVLTKILLQKYNEHFKKRYFPESEIHLRKLRIVQAFLILAPHLKSANKISVIDWITACFSEESHQPCVKQLMQFLLISLLYDDTEHLENISKIMDRVDRTHTSTITAFIPVLYHVALRRNEDFVERLIRVMLEWTMGAHFKLRVYSQVGIMKLLEMSSEKNYEKISRKYNDLYMSIKKVLDLAGGNVESILQTDQIFFDQFDLTKHYGLQNIYVEIPKLNGVPETEWENIDVEMFFSNLNVPIASDLIEFNNVTRRKCTVPNDMMIDDSINNIQRKNQPEKDLTDVEIATHDFTDLILVASLVDSPANLGGLARTCEIYGVKSLVLSDHKVVNGKEFKSLSMSSENWIDIIEVKSEVLEDYLSKLKQNGYIILGAEQTSESVMLHKYKLPKKCTLVLGNEKEGIPPHIFPFLDACIEIPQYGVVRSLNVHVTAAIIIWEYVKQNVLS